MQQRLCKTIKYCRVVELDGVRVFLIKWLVSIFLSWHHYLTSMMTVITRALISHVALIKQHGLLGSEFAHLHYTR